MIMRYLPIAAGVLCCALLVLGHPAHAGPMTRSALCGTPLPSGPLVEPPRVLMSSEPRNDRGVHEIVLSVYRAGDRFCYRYRFDDAEQHRAPTILVRPGETFAVRIVNELAGPARGLTMPASALAPCKPQTMPVMPVRRYTGYMNHTIFARAMPNMRDIDVNLHLHGFEGPPQQENVFLSTYRSPDRACEYVFTVPRTQPPGTYFYHPHAHGMADAEVARGLAGTWIVLPKTPALPASDDHVVVVRYRVPFELDEHLPSGKALAVAAAAHEAALKPAAPVRFDPFAPPPWPSDFPMFAGKTRVYSACGSRKGAKLAVDGVDAPAALTVQANEPQLVRLVNATSDSMQYLRVRDASSGAALPLRIVARDGVPVDRDDGRPLARYVSASEDPVPVAGRVDLLMTLKPRQAIVLYDAHTCTAPQDEYTVRTDLLVMHAGAATVRPTPLVSKPLDPARNPAKALVAYARSHPALIRRRAFTYTEYLLPSPHGKIHGEFYLTQTSDPDFHEQPFFPVYRGGSQFPVPDVVVRRGSIEEWYLFNATMEVHSFHIHQMAFVDENDGGAPVYADTVNIPFGSLLPNLKDPAYPLIKPSVTRVLLDFRNVPRGTFVFHCHTLFHEDRGMMGVIRVE
ncbi:MAG TPA: multicopper oxidase family protein [Candidatus Baltobacteraceae bacterium]|nr:multicopper oxidase family protein [Candidatus Baltobacteraceae bacterium]